MEKIKFANLQDVNNIVISAQENKSGIPFIINGERKVLNNNYNNVVISEDNIQKSEKIINPLIEQIINSNESFVINSKRRNLFDKYNDLLKEKEYNVICLDFDNPANGDNINIFELAYNMYKNNNKDKAVEIIEDVGYYIFMDEEANNSDPFWINSAINLFVGLTLYLFEHDEKIEFSKISELVDTLTIDDIEKNTTIYSYLSQILLAPTETKGGIISVFKQKFNLISTRENLSKMLSNSTFDLKDITNKKLAIFIVEGSSNFSKKMVSLIVNQIYFICNIYSNNNKINIILDDFDELCPIKNVESIIRLFEEYNINLTIFIKGFTKVERLYGSYGIPLIMTFFKNLLYLFSTDIKTLEHISTLCGSKEYIGSLISMKDDEAIYLTIRSLPILVNI